MLGKIMGFFSSKKPKTDGKGATPKSENFDINSELQRMEEESEKRFSHYAFAHQALRKFVQEQPLKAFAMHLSPDGTKLLSEVYNKVKSDCDDKVQIDITEKDFEITKTKILTMPAMVIKMPKTIRQAEAHMVAIVLLCNITELGDFINGKQGLAARYFTLEHGYGRNVLCEWDGDTHCNMGDGPEVNAMAFCQAIERILQYKN